MTVYSGTGLETKIKRGARIRGKYYVYPIPIVIFATNQFFNTFFTFITITVA